jgi:hypothetical protein
VPSRTILSTSCTRLLALAAVFFNPVDFVLADVAAVADSYKDNGCHALAQELLLTIFLNQKSRSNLPIAIICFSRPT